MPRTQHRSEKQQGGAVVDIIETRIGVPVTEMTPAQLLTYFEWGKTEVTGLKNPPGGRKEQGIFRSFQERYGKEEAGRMVQHVIFRRKCEVEGRTLGPSSFTAGSKWVTDLIQDDMNKHRKKSDPKRDEKLRSGFTSLMDL